MPLVFYLTSNESYVVNGNTTSFSEPILTFHPEEKNGTIIIEGHSGVFFLHFSLTPIDDYSFIIEQNIESIPESPSWIFLPLFVMTTLILTLVRRKLGN